MELANRIAPNKGATHATKRLVSDAPPQALVSAPIPCDGDGACRCGLQQHHPPRPRGVLAVPERIKMTSEPIRDPVTDDLLTPQNAALVVIDYQPSQVGAVRSIDHERLGDNIVSAPPLARPFDLPVLLSPTTAPN